MKDANTLPYYPRFILNFDDGKCFSTGDLDQLQHIKESGINEGISQFFPGQIINATWQLENNKLEAISYKVDKIEIRQIKYDLDEPTFGVNENDCYSLFGKEKKWLMEIYVFFKKLP